MVPVPTRHEIEMAFAPISPYFKPVIRWITPYCIIIALYGFRIISNCVRETSHRPKWRQKGFPRACYKINPSVRYGVRYILRHIYIYIHIKYIHTHICTYIELIFIYIIFKSGLAY